MSSSIVQSAFLYSVCNTIAALSFSAHKCVNFFFFKVRRFFEEEGNRV